MTCAWPQNPDPLPDRLTEQDLLERVSYPREVNATLRFPGAPGTMLSVHMHTEGVGAEAQEVWVVDRGGDILYSGDDGKTRQSQVSDTEHDLVDVTFDAQGDNGWAVGTFGTVTKIRDRGAIWRVVYQNATLSILLSAFALPERKPVRAANTVRPAASAAGWAVTAPIGVPARAG